MGTTSARAHAQPGRPRSKAAPRRPSPSRGADAYARYQRARASIMAGAAVRAARRRGGLSQVELAELSGMTQPAIARLERGLVSPTVITLDRIARAMGTDLVIDFEPQLATRASTGTRRRDS